MPHVTVEDLVAVLQQLPPEVSAVNAVSQGLWHLDSRAVAALLKVSLKGLQQSDSWSWSPQPPCQQCWAGVKKSLAKPCTCMHSRGHGLHLIFTVDIQKHAR